MLATTDAIVLSFQPYSDKAHILHAYTRANGRVNYMVYGIGRKNAVGKYTPLSLIQITASYPSSGMPVIKEASLSPLTSHLSPFTTDLYKQTIALFLSEVLFHVLRHPMQDEIMFDFLTQAIQTLDQTEEPQNFHLQFLIDFAAKLGFGIPETSNLLTSNPLTRAERQQSLRDICAYYEEHVETWRPPRSLDVLMEIFD